MRASLASPVVPEERYALIDALRGFALAGVLLINLQYLSVYALLPASSQTMLPTAAFDAMAVAVTEWLVNVKFITLFSLLFGFGFALQLERARARGAGGVARYARRLLVLAFIGAVHGFFVWWGDILLTYAVVGLLMLAFVRVPDRVLVALGIVTAVALPSLLKPWMHPLLSAMPGQAEVSAASVQAFTSTSWSRTLHANLMFSGWERVSSLALVSFVLGRFLLGLWAGRRGLLQRPLEHLPLLRRLCSWGFSIGVTAWLLSWAGMAPHAALPRLHGGARVLVLRLLDGVAPLALAIGYAAGFVLLYQRPGWQRRLGVLAPVGRMTLTHYLSQSVLGVVLFYGIGLGLGPRWGMAGVLGAWVLIFGTQVLLSHLWLARFRYGPVEWLWRWMTYGGPPPRMRPGPEGTPELETMRSRLRATSASVASLGELSREEEAPP
ncbi:DUF418 domain-containing protein [Frateuria soli]|uniref:DUF418 domain-containing protein n=1 Tax=Frateuria soli TaxID=1542730 RepID=UPI001E4C7A65|nr:DUF418 domain-containing protein [Frateuria soli]UGB36992.1 DUF418 domain-containing protein [Frateuria soli]